MSAGLTPTRVFVSYTSADRATARWMTEVLRSHYGLDAWIDLDGVKLGENAKRAVARALRNCAGVVMLLSHNAVYSPWVEDEIVTARHSRIFVCTARIDAVAVPRWALGVPQIDMRSDPRAAVGLLARRLRLHLLRLRRDGEGAARTFYQSSSR